MSANKRPSRIPSRCGRSQEGTAAVEVAILMVVFLTFVFGTIELARVMYVFNTLQEVTRRAASTVVNMAPAADNSTAMSEVRLQAMFRGSGDGLLFGEPVTSSHIRIEYLSLVRESDGTMNRTLTAPVPTSPAANYETCLGDPNAPNCVRFVRVRICEPGAAGSCDPVRYKTIFPFVELPLDLPRATTIAAAESLGYVPGITPGP